MMVKVFTSVDSIEGLKGTKHDWKVCESVGLNEQEHFDIVLAAIRHEMAHYIEYWDDNGYMQIRPNDGLHLYPNDTVCMPCAEDIHVHPHYFDFVNRRDYNFVVWAAYCGADGQPPHAGEWFGVIIV